jgi:hypothetical protein
VDLPSEALCACTGLWPRKPPDIRTLQQAEALPARWQSRLRRWLKADAPTPLTYSPPPEEQATLQDKLLKPLDVEETTTWIASLGEALELGAAYTMTIKAGREYLAAQWPHVEIPGIVPDALPLSPDEYEEVHTLCRVLDDPDTLLEDLDAYAITMSQVAALKTVYPALHGMLLDMLNQELVECLVKKRPISWEKEDCIRVLRGLAPEAQIPMPVRPPVEKRAKGKGWEIDYKSTRTPVDKGLARSGGSDGAA